MPDLADILDSPALYRFWQAPFADAKFAPILRHNRIEAARRVLDVGCGPGINTRYFRNASYVGVDLNPRYIEYAARQHDATFIVADVRDRLPGVDGPFDFILANSLFHHIGDDDTRSVLHGMSRLLADDGHVHILDLVIPAEPSISRWLATNDRGDYARPLTSWRSLFLGSFEPVVFESYAVGVAGVPLWNMVYFKGRRKDRT